MRFSALRPNCFRYSLITCISSLVLLGWCPMHRRNCFAIAAQSQVAGGPHIVVSFQNLSAELNIASNKRFGAFCFTTWTLSCRWHYAVSEVENVAAVDGSLSTSWRVNSQKSFICFSRRLSNLRPADELTGGGGRLLDRSSRGLVKPPLPRLTPIGLLNLLAMPYTGRTHLQCKFIRGQ